MKTYIITSAYENLAYVTQLVGNIFSVKILMSNFNFVTGKDKKHEGICLLPIFPTYPALFKNHYSTIHICNFPSQVDNLSDTFL